MKFLCTQPAGPEPRRLTPRGIACLVALLAPAADAADWSNWRGPTHNGVSPEIGLIENWDPKGGPESNVLWRSAELAGRSTPIVMGGKLYTIVRDQPATPTEGEAVVCADAATGEVIWRRRFNVYLSDVPDTRVGWSSVVGDPETGRVYALGVCGYFCCLEGDSGKPVWSRSLHEEFGLLSTYGGRTNFPQIHEDTVIISAVVIGWGDTPKWGLLAKPAHRFLGLDKATGELRWLSGTRLIPYDTTYSTPAFATLGGQEAMVFGSGDGALWAMQPGTGKPLWKSHLSRRGLNVSPVVAPDGRVFTGHSEENTVGTAMGAFVAVDGNQIGEKEPNDLTGQEKWIEYQAMIGKSSPLYLDGRVYAVDDRAKLHVFDAATGSLLGRKALGRVMRGSLLYADGKIYACTRGGRWIVLRPNDEERSKVETVARLQLPKVTDEESGETHNQQVDASPIAADGRLYLTTSEYVYCLALPGAKAAPAAKPADPAPITDKRVAQAQLVPWDSLLAPGQEQQYRLRLYNASGQFLREANPEKVSFGVVGPGKVTPKGVYRAPKDALHQTAKVICEAKGVSAEARLRIVPPLPWNFKFDSLEEVPLTWVGGRIRYVLRDSDGGGKHIAKPTELPTRPGKPNTKLGTRSRMWMGSPDLANYTIQADVQLQQGTAGETAQGAPAPEGPPAAATAIKLPSVGLINSRYTFALFGPNQQARLYSWCTHDKRTQASLDMPLEAGVWYRMKLSVVPKPKESKAIVQAKVWRRGEAEPGEWTLRLVDEAPNLSGSPGLFGDAKEAEFYVDNLKVTPNN